MDYEEVNVLNLTQEQLEAELLRTEYSGGTVAYEEEPWGDEDRDWHRYLDVQREIDRRAALTAAGE